MNKYKSAQGLSLNTIIIGTIVLIVLMVLVAVFGGFFGNRFTPQFAAATEQKCENPKPECDDLTEQEIFGNFGKDFPQGQKCCKTLSLSCKEVGGTCENPCKDGRTEVAPNAAGLEYVCSDPAKLCCKK